LRRGTGSQSIPTIDAKRLKYATECIVRAGAATFSGEFNDIQGVGHGKLAQAGIEVTDSGFSLAATAA